MTELPFAGYPGAVWSRCWQSLAWLNSILSNGPASATGIDNPVRMVLRTLRNGANAVTAWQIGAALSLESLNLTAIAALPISLDALTTSYFNARIAAVATAAVAITALPPKIIRFCDVVPRLISNQPAIDDPGYLEWQMAFVGESPPFNLTSETLVALAQVAATSWLNVATAIDVLQGNSPTSAYDTAARMYRSAVATAAVVAKLQSGGFASTINSIQLWNSIVALPTILSVGAAIGTSPALLAAQQAGVVRHLLLVLADQLALLLTSLRTSITSRPITAVLRNGETLADLAARETGDFENWTEIAEINVLKPPYPGPTNTSTAAAGRPLFMPGSNVEIGAQITAPSVVTNVLGVDYDFGPLNGAQPAWLGDISMITGLLNFARAIGRRLQTPLGSLVYHTNYGSRIPGEVGAVQSVDEAARLAAYGRSAIAADLRTASVLVATATVQPGFLATFSAVVQPIGSIEAPLRLSVPVLAYGIGAPPQIATFTAPETPVSTAFIGTPLLDDAGSPILDDSGNVIYTNV